MNFEFTVILNGYSVSNLNNFNIFSVFINFRKFLKNIFRKFPKILKIHENIFENRGPVSHYLCKIVVVAISTDLSKKLYTHTGCKSTKPPKHKINGPFQHPQSIQYYCYLNDVCYNSLTEYLTYFSKFF